MAFEHELRVRFGECDPQGIVFNANYVAWFDVALTELWRETLGSWSAMNRRGVDAVIAELNVRFRAPARADELVTLRIAVTEFGRTSVHFAADVLRGDELLVEGRMRHVFVDGTTWSPIPMPDWVRTGLERYAVSPGG